MPARAQPRAIAAPGQLWHDRRVTRELRIASPGVAPALAARLVPAARLDTLEDVVRFGFAQRPAWQLVDVVVQDEFTHDVIVSAAAPPGFLVFDTT